MPTNGIDIDVVVIGGGQAALAASYYLRRAGHEFVVLDDQPTPGGAWLHTWPSLRLFSPAEYSSLPGWPMPPWEGGFPPARHVVEYLRAYEQRYQLPIRRPVRVRAVARDDDRQRLRIETTAGMWRARRVLSATGTWQRPFWPVYPGARTFAGRHLHTVNYRTPDDFADRSVVVVGGGNSGAQLVAEISEITETTWVTLRPPRFLPDHVDGRVLFQMASRQALALAAGRPDPGGISTLGDIVMVPEVRAARDRGDLRALPMFDRLTRDGIQWDRTGERRRAEVILSATGFRPTLTHLRPLQVREPGGLIAVTGTQAVKEPRLHLLGYGDWTGPGSATLIGVGRTAKAAVANLDLHD